MLNEFINQYGMTILYTVLTAVASFVGLKIKAAYERYVNTREKKEIASTVVKFTEQVYANLHGDEKLDKAIAAATEMLAEHDIKCSELEVRVLIEAAVNSFNKGFKSETGETVEAVETVEASEEETAIEACGSVVTKY